MRGQESISFLLTYAFIAIITIVGLVLLFRITSNLNADEQIARSNVEKLRAAIDEACITNAGKGNPVAADLDIPQEKPFSGFSVGPQPFLRITELIQYRIRSDGDPKFVLYHEMFPPGEAIGWETYHDFEGKADYRIIAMVNGQMTKGRLSGIVDGIKHAVADRYPDARFPVVLIANVVLTGDVDLTQRDTSNLDSVERNFLRTGEWDKDMSFFSFANYISLPAVSKTLFKYESCGDDSLCLKTRTGVYALPLDATCKSFPYLQFVNKASSLDFKHADLHLVSPCKGKGKVRVFTDNCATRLEGPIGFNWPWRGKSVVISFTDPGKCTKAIRYPIYTYDQKNEEFSQIGEHTTCLDDVGGQKAGVPQATNIPCIRVVFDDKEGFCSTTNVEPAGLNALGDALLQVGLSADNIKAVVASTDYLPLTIDGTEVHAFVLKPYKLDSGVLQRLRDLDQTSWAWPD